MVVPICPHHSQPGAEHLGPPGLSSYLGRGRGPGARAAPGAAPGHQLPLGGGPPAGGVVKLPQLTRCQEMPGGFLHCFCCFVFK